jgi:peroxiredoxin Q/BCP
LKDKNTEVIGITFSPTEELKAWATEISHTAELLFDSDRSVAMTYGAAESADQERPKRVSVLIGPDGTVLKTYEVSDAEGHADEVLADLG